MKKKRDSFWGDMMSGANGGISSKRVIGGFILMVMLLIIVISVFRDSESAWLTEAIITMLVGAFSLLGIGVFEKKLPDEHDNNDDLGEI